MKASAFLMISLGICQLAPRAVVSVESVRSVLSVKQSWPIGPLQCIKIIGSTVSASCHFTDGSRLLFRLKQAQLFEAFSGPCPIAIAHIR